MAQSFPEKAHLYTDRKKYEENWERIFGKKKDQEEEKTDQEEQNKEDASKPDESC